MQKPQNAGELAEAIETLVASYLDEAHRAAQLALERSLSRPTSVTRASKRKADRPVAPGAPSKRRTAAELADLCERLYRLVCARPGEPMAVFADELGVASHALQRPMGRLKAAGRVRTVGQRHSTRYFPTVARPVANAG
jgi:hypothetical protein